MFTKRFIIAFTLCCLSLDNTSGKPFIDGQKPCKKSDPKLEECLLNILRQAKPLLIRGNPELNLPSLDPVQIPSVSIQKTLQDIKVTGELSNLIAKGANSINAKTFKVNLVERTWDMDIAIPLISFITDFNLNVTLRALHMPVFGKGQCNGKISRSVIRFHADTDIKDGKLKLNDIKINLNLGDVEANIIKSQNPALARMASEFFKANKRLVLDLVTPIAEDSAKELLLRQGNRILSTVQMTDFLVE